MRVTEQPERDFDSDPFLLWEAPLKGDAANRAHLERSALALFLALLVNGCVFFVLPWTFSVSYEQNAFDKNTLEIQLEDPVEELEQVYVDANPDVVDLVPDETNNFSHRNQQAAQPDVSEKINENGVPELMDEDKMESARIVPTDMVPDVSPSPPQQEDSSQAQVQARAQEASTPQVTMPAQIDFLKDKKAESDEGLTDQREMFEDYLDEDADAQDRVIPAVEDLQVLQDRLEAASGDRTTNGEGERNTASRAPMPRTRVVKNGPPGPLNSSDTGVSAVGAIAIDANFSEFGDYLSRTYDVIGIRWLELLKYGEASLAETSSRVRISFYITKEGEVEDLQVQQSTASSTAEWYCIDAIQSNAPFYEWTEDMVRILGDRQPITVTFIYR